MVNNKHIVQQQINEICSLGLRKTTGTGEFTTSEVQLEVKAYSLKECKKGLALLVKKIKEL